MRTLILIAATFIFSIFFSLTANAQKEKTSIAQAVKSHKYIFKANTAIPTGGRSRQLSGGYDLKVSKDTVISYLPYFGRAYTAPIGTDAGGIEFTSSKFSYDEKQLKKGGWEIRIKPTDTRDVQLLLLNFSSEGYGSLQVTSNNRQPISFNGVVEELDK